MSNAGLDDIDSDSIATVITQRDITKMYDQLDYSMGAYMQYFQVLCILLSAVMCRAWKAIMADYTGWFAFRISAGGYAKMFLFVLIGYLIVAAIDFRRIKKVPMDAASKSAE